MNILNLVLLFLTCINIYTYNLFELNGIGSVIPAYAKNINFLNDCNRMDKIFTVCYYMDLAGKYSTGYDKRCPLFEAKIILKTQGTFTQDQFIAPLPIDRPLHFFDTDLDDHLHFINRPIFWVNELWIRMNIGHMLSLPTIYRHTLTFGLFPFILGRGIALGFNNIDYQLRFFLLVPTFSIVNQYPPGILLSGKLFNTIAYDVYGSIVTTESARLQQTALVTKREIYGHRRCGQRGFGAVHYYTAARLLWDPIVKSHEKAHMEAYGVFDNNPLINSPFSNERAPIDITNARTENQFSRIKSFGVAGEYTTGSWEFGFDTAKNFGYSIFLGSDTNTLGLTTTSGFIQTINNKVNLTASGIPAPATSENQFIINTSIENQAQNGKPISPTLTNGATRFRDTFTILMRGWMFIADAAYQLDSSWKAAVTLGISSGGPLISQLEQNVIINNNFIGLQELYVGKRVVNAFFLNGSYIGPRPVDIPNKETANLTEITRYGFTNMILTGTAMHYHTKLKQYPLTLNPNLLGYWSYYAATNFSKIPPQTVPRFYGTEFNIFAFLSTSEHMKWVGVVLLFFPGTFFKALKNQPLTKDDFDYVAQINSGKPANFNPLLGSDPGYVFNLGIEWAF